MVAKKALVGVAVKDIIPVDSRAEMTAVMMDSLLVEKMENWMAAVMVY